MKQTHVGAPPSSPAILLLEDTFQDDLVVVHRSAENYFPVEGSFKEGEDIFASKTCYWVVLLHVESVSAE